MPSHSASLLERDHSSSPDPLASSPNVDTETSISSRRAIMSNNRKSGPRQNNKQRTSLDSASILPPSSPSRTITEQTLSPWKIRVTVEAEPEYDGHEPVQTITRTMKIPLREESSPAQLTQEKSQPRTRKGSTSRTRRRSATPTTERRRRQSVTDLDIIVLGDDADEDEWGKSKPKNSPKKTRARKGSTQRRVSGAMSTEPVGFEIRPDTDVEYDTPAALRDDSPELRQIDLNRVSIRSRANSVKQKSHHYDRDEDQAPRTTKPLPNPVMSGRRTVSANSAMSYPTPSPTASERGQSVEAEVVHEHGEGFDTIMESEGFTMIDLESIPSVKQMLSSPSEGNEQTSSDRGQLATRNEDLGHLNASVLQTAPSPSQPSPLKAIPPHLILPEGESDISCTVSSSPPTFQPRPQIARQVTPLTYLQVPAQPRDRQVTPQPYASPKLPSPPRQSASKDRSTPDSAKAMRAGIALQGALEPAGLNLVLPPKNIELSKDAGHTRSSSDEIFDGFDSSTKRELRAGLRFGEELAKRQTAGSAYQGLNVQKSRHGATQVWRGESVISRTPVQSLAEQNRNLQGDQLELRDLPATATDTDRNVWANQQEIDLAHRREQQWQLERQAVSSQIQNAESKNVIIIESEDENSGSVSETEEQSLADLTMDDEGDVWLEEAKDSSSSPRQETEPIQQFSTLSFDNEAKEEGNTIDPPRRSVIPSPWKRGEQIQDTNNSTIMTNGDEVSGLFWKQPQTQDATFGAAAINNVRREYKETGDVAFMTQRSSGGFDIEKMLNTPKRIRESLEKEQCQQSARSGMEQISPIPDDVRSIDEAVAGDVVEDEVEDSPDDEKSSPTLHHLQVIPVNFNDSSSIRPNTPPQSAQPRKGISPPTVRPPTPRSAMKGSRQSVGAASGPDGLPDGFDQESRRVVFAERSRGVNIDWVENSSSVQLFSEDGLSSPIVEHQKHHDYRQATQVSTSEPPMDDEQPELVQAEDVEIQDAQKPASAGWLGWLWKNKANDNDATSVRASQTDGSSEPNALTSLKDVDGLAHHVSSSPSFVDSSNRHSSVRPGPSRQQTLQIPSYLLPPSYPSDPTRDPQLPLSTSGPFTNIHFRTLHILHRKSQRPRFHAPKLSACRMEIRKLVADKWKLEVDESDAGLGGFAWVMGETEARVLERFCREVEYSSLSADQASDTVRTWLDDRSGCGIWTGHTPHGQGDVAWSWTVTELATWLGRIVVGEVVREEEFGGSKYVSQ